MARVVVTTLGTLGDLHPMFPIAKRLIEGGHTVHFVVPPKLHDVVVEEGFSSRGVELMPTPPPENERDTPAKAKASLEKNYTPFLRRAIGEISASCRDADVLLSTPHQVATAIVGKTLQIPWVTVTVFPGLIPSAYTVPEPHWLPALPTPAGRLVNRLTWATYRYALRYLSDDAIAMAVESLGIEVDKDLFAPGGVSPYLCLVLSSTAYSPRLPDWPATVKVCGFAPWDKPHGWKEPPGLERFIQAGPPPVVVTTSTAEERDAVAYLEACRQALVRLGRRGLLLTGRASESFGAGWPDLIERDGIAIYPYVPLSRILPHASFVIHHGGIGTGTATIQHGLPAVVIPAFFDQWYNAGRLRALGVAGVVKIQNLTVDRLAREIQRVDADPRYRARARELAKIISSEDGAARAVDEIEALLKAKPRASQSAVSAD